MPLLAPARQSLAFTTVSAVQTQDEWRRVVKRKREQQEEQEEEQEEEEEQQQQQL